MSSIQAPSSGQATIPTQHYPTNKKNQGILGGSYLFCRYAFTKPFSKKFPHHRQILCDGILFNDIGKYPVLDMSFAEKLLR